MSEYSQGPGWWQASDGKWYPPQSHPSQQTQPTQPPPPQPFSAPPPYGQPGPYQPYGAPQMSRKTNGLAIAALVCGILWGFGVLAVLALVFGIIALQQIKKREESGRGLAIAGIILGGIGVLGAISSIIFVVAVSDEISDISKPASVRIQASQDVCWTARLDTTDSDINGTQESGCGSALFSLGKGLGREAKVTNVSGQGSVRVQATLDGEVTDSATAGPSETVSVKP